MAHLTSRIAFLAFAVLHTNQKPGAMSSFSLHRTPPAPARFSMFLGDFGRPYAFRIIPFSYCTTSHRISHLVFSGARVAHQPWIPQGVRRQVVCVVHLALE